MSQSDPQDPLLKQAARLTQRARAWLFWERYAPVLALAAVFISAYLIGAFGGIWERVGDPWRVTALIIALYFIIKAVIAARKVSPPTWSDAARRVEADNGVKHRPLDVIADRAALNAGGSSMRGATSGRDNLWDRHVGQARKTAQNLRPAKPRAVLAARDKYYVRFIAPLAVMLALMVGAGDNWERLSRSLSPSWQSPMSAKGVSYDAWVDPPDYTGRPPVYFKDKRNIDVPAGSELVARISGLKDAPRLKLITNRGSRYLSLTRLGPDSFEARTVLDQSVTARWRIGTQTKAWDISVLPDTPPTVTIDTPPKADKRDRLAFRYSMRDDFGVQNLNLVMSLMDGDDRTENTVGVPLSSRSVRKANGTDVALDMTKHIWTGRKVRGRLVAIDGLGQSAQTDSFVFTIPDKIFIEPLAKAVVEQRNLVLAAIDQPYAPPPRRTRQDWENMPMFDQYQIEDRMGRAPQNIQRAAALIDAITDAPAGLYEDPAVYMGLKNVLGRLRYATENDQLAGIPQDLWNIAIRAEFGVLGTALEEMRAAQVALNDGIARRAPEREIDTLFERYDAAVERYMEELRRKAIEEGNVAESGEGGGMSGRNADEIQELLKAIEEANAQGDTEGARRALARLAELLENMQIQLAQGGGGGEGGNPQEGDMSDEMKESLEDLADLLGEQRELKDETEQAERRAERGEQNGQEQGQGGGQGSGQGGDESQSQGQQGEQAPKTAQELAEQQAQLEALLDQLETGLPEGPLGQTRGDQPGGSAEGGTQDGGSEDGGSEDGGSEDGDQAGGANPNGEPSENGSGGGDGDPNAEARGGSGGTEPATDPKDAIAQAGEAMQAAKDALEAGDLEGAGAQQQAVIDALRDAAQALAQQAAQGRGEGEGSEQAQGQGNPLGQNNNGENDGLSEADIDQRDNATRSRELMEELRRRAAEQEREQSERDYLERLLKRF